MSDARTMPVILLWGEDRSFVRAAAVASLDHALPREISASEWSPGELQRLATPSLFDERRALVVYDAQDLGPDALRDLATYLERPEPDASLILCCTVPRHGEPPGPLQDVLEGFAEVREIRAPRERRRPRIEPASAWAVLPHLAAIAGAGVLWWLAVRSVDLRAMDDTGLFSVLPATFYAGLALLTVSFCAALRGPRAGWLLALHLVALIAFLHAVPSFVEPFPRLNATWRHTGIIDYIERTGSVQPPIDAYFSWPSFFSFGAFVVPITGLPTALELARWAPPVFDLLYLAPMLVIFTSFTSDRRVVWLGCWLFYLTLWVGQDYFSPQGFTFFLYLCVLALLLRYFRAGPLLGRRVSVGQMLRSRRSSEYVDDPVDATPRSRLAAIVLVLIASAAIIASHQLTPFALIVAVSAIAIARRMSLRTLPVLIALMEAAWLMFVALAYLRGHLTALASNIGELGQNVNAGVLARVQGSGGHLFVVRVRLLLSGLVWVAAAAAVVRRLRHRTFDVTCLCLALAPFALVGVQPYGGEILLRAFLFSLPFMCFLGATLFWAASERVPSVWRLGIVGVVSVVLAVALVISKYGNELGEYFAPNEVAAVDQLYAAAGPRSLLVAVTPSVPWKNRHYDWTYEIMSEAPQWPSITLRQPTPGAIMPWLQQKIREHHVDEALLVIERSQEEYANLLGLAPAGWIPSLDTALRRSPEFIPVYSNARASIFLVKAAS
jgi:hypothetical protein